MTTDALNYIMAYKGVYALSTLNEKTKQLKATHYACCLVSGPSPVWGVWTVGGRFVRFFGLKSEIAEHYPKLVWRRKMASWALSNVDDLPVKERVHELEERYGSTITRHTPEPAKPERKPVLA